MGCGAGVAYASDGQKEEMFTAATKEMMKMCVVDGYLSKDELKVLAPGEAMAKARAFNVSLYETAAIAKIKCVDTVGSGTDKVDEAAADLKDKMKEKGGFLGGLVGSVVEGAANVTTTVVDTAASGTGFLAEKAIKAVAIVLEEAIKQIDEPFEAVGKDIFELKKTEIIGSIVRSSMTAGSQGLSNASVARLLGAPPNMQRASRPCAAIHFKASAKRTS